MKHNLSEKIKSKAINLGFDRIGIAKAGSTIKQKDDLDTWISNNGHATMDWLSKRKEERGDIHKYFPDAKSVISVAMNYYVGMDQSNIDSDYKFSNYAWGEDYHEIIKKKLHDIKNEILKHDPSIKIILCVDTAPIMEKQWAQKAGIGWEGKNTNLLTKELGSWVFLAEILIDKRLDYDSPFEEDLCGSCTECIDSCPTNALTEYKIDSNKCISYLTIEYREDFENEDLHNWIYGCDVCQEVCPWNIKFEKIKKDKHFEARDSLINFFKSDWENLNEENFKSSFKNSAVKRTKYKGLKRNIDSLR